ncbi:hypothetical protein [Sphingomonas sp. Mn802worker]|uniref:hypothetical protein n=1 Tax=Sphingomonas sp. Mn802worker TaxID=629773 RepID=UPI0003A9B715|nr:hypothetical protein [Sphingomonas sp. Mn802worker]
MSALKLFNILALPLALTPVSPLRAQVPSTSFSANVVGASSGSQPSYPDFADLVVDSPLIIDATVRSAARIKGVEAVGIAPDAARFYVEADVGTLVRAAGAIPARIGWLVDVPLDARGRPPSLKKQRVLAFARPVAGRPDQVQLVAKDAQRPWSPAAEALTRRIATEAASPDAPPILTGVKSAFYVPGTLPGEGETQIFLLTKNDRPAAISVLRRPGEQPRWSIALSEVIDENATAPARDTLLWYRLACFLPRTLPNAATTALDEADVVHAREDYAFVIQQLGACHSNAAGAISGDGAPA